MSDDYPYDLGGHRFPVTATPEAQVWFDRGLTWTYGFNHDEAVRCFRRAAEADPACAMAHWGIAYASGPNYNITWDQFDEAGRVEALATAFEATQTALSLTDGISAEEAAMIKALPARFPQPDPIPPEDMGAWDDAFASAMAGVQARFPDNREIRSVAVEAMMQRTPWAMWDLATGAIPGGADTATCQRLLEEAFANDPAAWRHPGLLHLYVHLMEMSATPEAALRHGDVLKTLVPDAGHLVHMASHIDVLCGNYRDVVYWNQQAVIADRKFHDREGAFNIYSGYRHHNLHFVIYGAMFLGQIGPALEAERGIWDTTPEELLRVQSPPMADFFEGSFSYLPHILVRFGRWRDCLELELPEDQTLYCSLVVNVHYARALAHAALGEVTAARAEQGLFLAACDRVPDSRLQHNCRTVDINEVAKAMLEGEILYREGEFDAAFAELRRACDLSDGLNYDEPWRWMQPVRHALGALLLEQGHIAEAEAAFRADLGLGGQASRAVVHPDNVWALKGLHDCLVARGETAERPVIAQKLALAEARADGPVKAACGCAQTAMAG